MKNNQTLIAPVAITAYSALSASGLGCAALCQDLQANYSKLAPLSLFNVPFPAYVGEIKQPLLSIREQLSDYNCRNARVALTALNDEQGGVRAAVEAAKEKYGAHRIGVIIGTSTSGLYETEDAYGVLVETGKMPDDFHFVTEHAYQATGRFVQLELGLTGVCFAISTACSSGAKAIAAGQRLISAGICDAVLVGGVDTLCRLTLRGFRSLELVANQPCKPMDKDRQGISIGEAAGLMLLEKCHAGNADKMKVLSVGESSDAHHMSTPHPDGEGAALAMRNALQLAGLQTESVDYLNLHATATKINDRMESRAVFNVFADAVLCSGTKGITGHTLGAAGALETIIALLALQHQFIPGTQGLQKLDEECQCQVVNEPVSKQNMHIAMSNSFGFGGNNASVIVAL
jgi:3-oxoacyl-[acyl-carrier-protein] synthase-1